MVIKICKWTRKEKRTDRQKELTDSELELQAETDEQIEDGQDAK